MLVTRHMTIIQNIGVTTAYHTVDDVHVMEVNGSILPMLPGSFLREKEPGYEAKSYSQAISMRFGLRAKLLNASLNTSTDLLL